MKISGPHDRRPPRTRVGVLLTEKFSAEFLLSGLMVVNLITNWAEENNYTEPVKFIYEDGAHGKGYVMDALKYAKENPESRARSNLIGDVSFEKKTVFTQLHAADRLIHLTCRSINRFPEDETSVDEEMALLTKIKLVKIHKVDRENLPQLKQVSDQLLKIAKESRR